MDMPNIKPVKPAKPRDKWFSVAWLATIIVIVFAFCFWINVPEWH